VNRTPARTLVLAALAVLALGIAAATIDTAVTGGSGGGFGSSGATGSGTSGADGFGVGENADGLGALLTPVCLPILTHPAVVLGLLALFTLLLVAVYRETRSMLPVAAVFVSFGIPGYVLWAFFTVCSGVRDVGGVAPGAPSGNFSLPQGGGGLPGSGSGQLTAPTALFGLLLVVALVGAAALLFFSTGDDDRPESTGETEAESPAVDVRDIGRAAGTAADRIEGDADVENEVFRAWSEMTRLLDIPNPRTSTPGEFADAAVAAGMERDDVAELTRLFEAVRYGGERPTDDREARAVAALRRIESAYAGERE
jgi:hypothetical protein